MQSDSAPTFEETMANTPSPVYGSDGNAQTAESAQTEKAPETPPEDRFSHYLTLADGTTVKFNIGDDPNGPFPAEINGVPVIGARNATVGGPA